MDDKEIKRLEKMSRLKKSNAFAGIIFTVLGGVLALYPGLAISLLCTILGVAILIIGVAYIITNVAGKREGLSGNFFLGMGIVLVVIGLWFITRPDFLLDLLPMVFGVIVVIDGCANIGESVLSARLGNSSWWVSLLLAILTIVMGCYLIFRPFNVMMTIARVIGVIMIFNGITDLIIVSGIKTQIKNADIVDSKTDEN
ncbi:MAG: DUF308 domain-containing protein [Eubacteriales bacterium]|nr:DUF308 domain-containing protein [Eubacteriales bacterium]